MATDIVKTCAICGTANHPAADTCKACGEASWVAVPTSEVPVRVEAPAEQPRGKRR